MTDVSKLLKKIQAYKSELTWESDQRSVSIWESEVKGAIIRAEIAKMDGIKDLVSQLKDKIVKCNFVLQNDKALTIEERDKLFVRKEEQMWLISFFDDPIKILAEAEAKVLKDLSSIK